MTVVFFPSQVSKSGLRELAQDSSKVCGLFFCPCVCVSVHSLSGLEKCVMDKAPALTRSPSAPWRTVAGSACPGARGPPQPPEESLAFGARSAGTVLKGPPGPVVRAPSWRGFRLREIRLQGSRCRAIWRQPLCVAQSGCNRVLPEQVHVLHKEPGLMGMGPV